MKLVYTAWDGSQGVKLHADKLFQSLSEHLSRSENLMEALEALLRLGSDDRNFQLVGLDDLLAEAGEAIVELLSTWNLDHCLDAHQSRYEGLIEDELEADADAEATLAPRTVLEGLDFLRDRKFAASTSSRIAEDLLDDASSLVAVAGFKRRWSEYFVGPRAADFEETRELMERLDALRSIEQDLADGDLGDIDMDLVSLLMGPDVADALEMLRQVVSTLSQAGYTAERDGSLALSAKGVRKLGQLALQEILSGLRFDANGAHETSRLDGLDPVAETHKRYQFGDPMTLDVGTTLRNAMLRENAASRGGKLAPGTSSARIPLKDEDFEVWERRRDTRAATVVLLDLSWSMSWDGRFAAAKKVVLAMSALMRSRYPQDYFAVVGFYTRAVELDPRSLAEVTWNMGDPFTNLQDGLRMATGLLGANPAQNQQMIVITDGQPTAYYADGRLYCEWPSGVGELSTRATIETLREVRRVTQRGIRINTFMLDDSPPLRAFVEKMTAINRGRAFYTSPESLGEFLLVDYARRRRKVF